MSPDALHLEAFGSTCHLFAIDAPAGRLLGAAGRVRRWHRRLTRFEPDSEVGLLNAASGSWLAVSPLLEDLLRQALAAWESSGGLVHAGVLQAMHAIGYTRS